MRNLSSIALVGSVLVVALLPIARADDFVNQANALYADVEAAKRSDTILLPALAKLEAAPSVLGTREQAALLTTTSPNWAQVKAWAEGANQKAVLAALARATASVPGAPMAFGQPYGAEAVSPDLVRAKMYTDLGDPPMLSSSQPLYLTAMDNLALLTNVDATRRLAAGEADGAIEVLWQQVILGRQMADRQFTREALWGYNAAAQGLERIRDIAYLDDRAGKKLTDAKIKDLIARLEPIKGDLRPDRLRYPKAERLGADQVLAAVYVPRGGADAQKFSIVMTRLGAGDLPLRRFGESAYWRNAAGLQKNWFDATEALQRANSDFESRWPLDWFDQRNQVPPFMSKIDHAALAVLDLTLGDLTPLFEARQVFRTEIVGTRSVLAVMGYARQTKGFPPQMSSARGREWIQSFEADPFNPNRAAGAQPPMRYFVPMRDTKDQFGKNEEPQPHPVTIITQQGENFKLTLAQDVFIIYSMGSDYRADWARLVQNTAKPAAGADYLIWPPVISLYRQHLMDSGELK